jgi:hypothetical protein
VIADVDEDDVVLCNNQPNGDAVLEVDGHAVQPRQLAGKCVKAKRGVVRVEGEQLQRLGVLALKRRVAFNLFPSFGAAEIAATLAFTMS